MIHFSVYIIIPVFIVSSYQLLEKNKDDEFLEDICLFDKRIFA